MSDQIELTAVRRSDVGKGASRRLRRADKVPGIIYGGEAEPVSITVEQRQLSKALQVEAFFSQVLKVDVEGDAQEAVVRDMQRHPATEKVMHIDFVRVSQNKPIEVVVPLHFINEEQCVGAKVGGGTIARSLTEVAVSALPRNLPEFIEVDLEHLDLGESVHLSDLVVADSVTLVELSHGADHDLQVISVNAPRGSKDDEEEGVESASAEGAEGDAAE